MIAHQEKPSPPPSEPHYYVGIGASAGGLEALDGFFTHMAPDSGLAFIVIQHLSPDYKSLMVELLSKRTAMAVRRAEEGMRVERDTVYLIPPGKQLTIFHGKLILRELDHHRGVNLPIDIFLSSLAEDQGDKTIAVILSGTGSDGVRGLRSVKEAGGMIMVQSEESAKFDGMPRAAIATGLVDMVLSPEEMPRKLLAFTRHPFATVGNPPQALLSDEDGLTRIFSLLREQVKVDFTLYKPSTVLRRIERRMTVNQSADLRDYVRVLETRPGEVTTLYRELLIGVTSFFRDRDVFQELGESLLPALLHDLESKEARLWVAGCSTGEEAYTLAILAQECMERLKRPMNVKIFATDIDREAIVRAGTGIYPESIAADLPHGFLSKYFTRNGDDRYQVQRNIREMVVFAQHNLIKDPPFTNIDVLSCRNLLIYLQPVLQQKVMEHINFSLKPQGILLLGTSETPGEMGEYFEPLHHKLKIYRSRGKKRPSMDGLRFDTPPDSVPRRSPFRFSQGQQVMGMREEERLQERLLQSLAEDCVPVVAVVNQSMELLHLVGDAEGILRLPSGKLSNDICRMAVKELAIPLATGLQKVFQKGAEVKYTNIRLPRGNGMRHVQMRLRLLPGRKGQEPLAGIFFQEAMTPKREAAPGEGQPLDITREAEQRIEDLEQELQFTKENLQATIEELETSNEELQATNEELLASNEELQSTNEELQSVNEELHTVNAEYQTKILELTEMTNDLENLMAATRIGTLFLDENLDIRKFTPEVERIFRILPNDVGRPLAHLTHNLQEANVLEIVEQVEKSGHSQEMEVQTTEGTWHLMRVLPYRIGGPAASGVVLTFLDIHARRQSEERLARERAQLVSIFESVNHIICVIDMDTCEILYANKAAQKAFGSELAGKVCYQEMQGAAEPCQFCTNDIIKEMNHEPYEWEYYNPVTQSHYQIIDRVIQWPDGRDVRFELAIDITRRKQAEEALRHMTDLLKSTQRLSRTGGWEWQVPQGPMFWTEEVYRIHGLDPDHSGMNPGELLGRSLECYDPGDRARAMAAFERCCRWGEPYDLRFPFTDFKGQRKRVRTLAYAMTGKEGKISKVMGAFMDITPQHSEE